MLNQFKAIQQVAEESIEGGVLLLLLLIVHPQVEAHAVELRLIVRKSIWIGVCPEKILI